MSDPPLPSRGTHRGHRTGARRQFAPVSAELPARVRWTAWYFETTGVLTLLGVAVAAVAVPLQLGPFAGAHLVLGALGALAVFSAWGDLRNGGWRDDEPPSASGGRPAGTPRAGPLS